MCKTESQWGFAVRPKQGLCNNIQGWAREGDGREVQEGGGMYIPVAASCWYLTENSKIL